MEFAFRKFLGENIADSGEIFGYLEEVFQENIHQTTVNISDKLLADYEIIPTT